MRAKGSTRRDYRFPLASQMAKVAIGMRRSGKTYFLFQIIHDLIEEKIPLETILYLNFEDDRLLPLDHKKMGELIDAWYTLYPHLHQKKCYLFLDEVQNVDGWPIVIRRLLDTKNIQLYLTGSSAKLLSKEIASSLRGRSIALEIFPFSYTEFINHHQLEIPKSPFGKQTLDHQRKQVLEYFQIGGFPAVQSMDRTARLEVLQNYVETVVFRDIVERYKITNILLLKYLIRFLLKNVGAPFTVYKFFNDIKSQGYRVSKDTLYTYMGYLEDAFLIFTVPLFTELLRRLQTTPKKVYAVDNGLLNANTFNVSTNNGKLFENQVYLDLRRQGKKIYYYRTAEGYEVDFVTQDAEGRCELIQVVWEAEEVDTIRREELALEQAKKELGLPGSLITLKDYIKLKDLAR